MRERTGPRLAGSTTSAYIGATPTSRPAGQLPEWAGSLVTEQVDASGLMYRRNRYYDPQSGRFTQPDPIGLAGGLNAYGYANGDPVTYSDPFGLCPIPILCEAIDVAAVGLDIRDIKKNGLGWGNGLSLTVDVLAVAIPVVPAGAGAVYRGARTGIRVANEAHSAFRGAQLTEHLRQIEQYGAAGFKELANGRIRYYGNIDRARTPGEMAGRRLVREWDPATGATRTWHETIDAEGRVRIVRPETGGEKFHHIFDKDGRYVGVRR